MSFQRLTSGCVSVIIGMILCWAPTSWASGASTQPLKDWSSVQDEDGLAWARQQGSEGLLKYLEGKLLAMPEYELWIKRQERLSGGWNEQPFVNYIKYRHQPRQVYMSWLKGGPKAGQEILFDETKRKDAMYGHLPGILNVTSIWTGLESSLAKANSLHTVRDAGLHSVVEILRTQLEARRQGGQLPPPDQVEWVTVSGRRLVAVTWIIPPQSERQGYAHRTRICLDAQMPWIRQVESWDEQGHPRERILFERAQPARFTQSDFDADNGAYSF